MSISKLNLENNRNYQEHREKNRTEFIKLVGLALFVAKI